MKYLPIPLTVFVASIMIVPKMTIEADGSQEKPYLVDFGRQGDVEGWRVVNDGVMGGLSRSQIHKTPNGTAVFKGHLSLENNGGFASVRRLLDDVDLSDYDGIILRVRGDGRTYQIRFRTDRRFDGATYRATFGTETGQWKLARISFKEFEPTFRGRLLPKLGPLDTAHLQQIAFMVADKKQGSFHLEIEWVKPFVSE